MPQLKIKAGPGKGKIFTINSDSVKLGREGSCDIKLKDNGVSREHAEIYKVGEMYFIRDLSSRNGIIVNDLPIEDELLRDGDIIKICNFHLVFTGSAITMDDVNNNEDPESDSFFESDDDPASTLTLKVSSSGKSRSAQPLARLEKALARLIPIYKKNTKIPTIIDETVKELFETMEVQECYFFLIEPGHRLVQKSYKAEAGRTPGKASKSIVLRALKEGETIFTANAQDDFRFKSENSIILKNVNSVLCSPLVAAGREIGVIYMNNGPLKPPFNDESAEIVTIIASTLALTIANLESSTRERVTHANTVKLLSGITESHAKIHEGRGERVAKLCQEIGKYMQLKPFQLEHLAQAAHLHHIGYMEYPKDHGYSLDGLQNNLDYVRKTTELLARHGGFDQVYEIVAHHRYHKDGSGYPAQLEGKACSIESQILALAVEIELKVNQPMSFQANTRPLSDIVKEVKPGLLKIFEPKVVNAFLDAFKDGVVLNG